MTKILIWGIKFTVPNCINNVNATKYIITPIIPSIKNILNAPVF